jgi:stress-induced-phosphoprotein 1
MFRLFPAIASSVQIMDFQGAMREVEKALELDPKYVKAWAKKGDIHFFLKEFHKAKDSYEKASQITASFAAIHPERDL